MKAVALIAAALALCACQRQEPARPADPAADTYATTPPLTDPPAIPQ
jgi:hypothetical protein